MQIHHNYKITPSVDTYCIICVNSLISLQNKCQNYNNFFFFHKKGTHRRKCRRVPFDIIRGITFLENI